MKSWYSRVSDIELKDGSIRTNYVVTFETDNFKLKREVEKYLQGIMDKAENSSEIPNNCDTCKWGEWYRKGYDITMMDDECGGCCSWNSKWTPKDEPTISKMEQVETMSCQECKHWDVYKGCRERVCKYEPKDEPQPFDKPPKCLGCLYSDLDKAFHPCASCVDFGKYVGEASGKYEPQTDCAWK